MKPIYIEELINLWLEKYHGITVQQVFKEHPDWDSKTFYKTYQVTQQQHDDWYKEAIALVKKRKGLSIKYIKRVFAFDYLNCAPDVKTPPEF